MHFRKFKHKRDSTIQDCTIQGFTVLTCKNIGGCTYSGVGLSFYTYLINTNVMRSLLMGIKYIKSAARVFNRDCVNKRGLDLS